MASTASTIAFGDAYSSLQAHTINGSVHIGTLRGLPRTVKLLRESRTLSRHLKQDLRTPSVVYRTLPTRPSTRTQSGTIRPALPTRASTSSTRYTAGRREKTSDASSGCAAWRARASRRSRGPSRAGTTTSSVWRLASSSRAAAATPAKQTSSSQASQCSLQTTSPHLDSISATLLPSAAISHNNLYGTSGSTSFSARCRSCTSQGHTL